MTDIPEPIPAPATSLEPAQLPDQFFEAGLDIHALDDLDFTGRPTVLERLGPAHFRSKGFSFMGFLQTVYDHVAETAQREGQSPTESPDPSPLTESPVEPSDRTVSSNESTESPEAVDRIS